MPTKIVQVQRLIPNEILECVDLRYVPTIKTDKDVSNYILVLHGGYMDCYEKLQKIKELQNDEQYK